MEIHVGLERCPAVAGDDRITTMLDKRASAKNALLSQARGCKLHRERLDCRSILIDRLKKSRLDRCDGKPATAGLGKKSLGLEHRQGMSHRLPGNVQAGGDAFLCQA